MKLDASFSNAQFIVDGFSLYRVDRNTHGGVIYPIESEMIVLAMKMVLRVLQLIGSVGHHQCYINWSSAPYPSNIQAFKIIR